MWDEPFHHSPIYKPYSMGAMHGLFGYYGPPEPTNYLAYVLAINLNYLMFLTLILLGFCLLLSKIVHFWEGPQIFDLIFDLVSQSFGQTRNRIYAYAFEKILLITAFFLSYIFWSVNCATLFSNLTLAKTERFNSYAELNASNRIVYISNSTKLRFRDANAIDRFI